MIWNLGYVPRLETVCMKNLMIAMLVFFSLSAASAMAGDEPEVCTATYENLAGEEILTYVECESPYAGQCLKETLTDDGKSTKWLIVDCK